MKIIFNKGKPSEEVYTEQQIKAMSRAEIKNRDQDRPCLHFCLYRRVWSLSLSSEQHAGLPVFPGPFCIPGL